MAKDPAEILVGAPNQLTTGAIKQAPLGSVLPTDACTPVDPAFKDAGYVSKDGLKLTPSYSISDITDWNGELPRRVLETFTGEITWTSIQLGEQDLKNAFGDDNVTVTPATSQHGVHKAVKIGAHLPEVRQWVFDMKDGDNLIRVVVPRGQITKIDAMSFVRSSPISIPVTLSCYADESGESVYLYTDNGVFTV